MALVLAVVALPAPVAAAGAHHVDCGAPTDGSGSRSDPWNNLARVNATVFGPGDEILLRRGTACIGMLRPPGSGSDAAPIRLGAYGTGPRPVIRAGDRPAAIRLHNQHHWEISSVETTGGDPHGIAIGGDRPTVLRHFRLTNVSVHDVRGTAASKHSGLIDVAVAPGSAAVIDDVVVDGATAYRTGQWRGIHVGCAGGHQPAGNQGRIVIRNSTVHDVGGDGITIYACSNGLIDNNVAHDVGLVASDEVGTPNGIWTWACADCTVQRNEGYRTRSPARDGGVYDIDWNSRNTTVQYNYGHDAEGYCVAVFGAWGLTTSNSVVRYNVCENNGRDPSQAFQGDIYLATWEGGRLDGVRIHNNTVDWDPAASHPALRNRGTTFSGTRPRVFVNNLIRSRVPEMISSNAALALDHNLYWRTGGEGASWSYGGDRWSSFAAYRAGSGQDRSGRYTSPRLLGTGGVADAFRLREGSPAVGTAATLSGMGSRDYFGHRLPRHGAPDIGAHESPYARNVLANPGFEVDATASQTPAGWATWSRSGTPQADFTVVGGTPQGGRAHARHAAGVPYDAFTYQHRTGLSDGRYRLVAWVRSSGGQRVAWMEANLHGGPKTVVDLPATSTWRRVAIGGIPVTGGEVRIGFYSIADSGQWLEFDDVRLEGQ
ncbi:MAG: right-handed parallel beta-helix repeat-containing protein [Euzebyales bacterium]|nr:right-handed parallel beta-helix repeat-containing protein [Euzebyales bacterium]